LAPRAKAQAARSFCRQRLCEFAPDCPHLIEASRALTHMFQRVSVLHARSSPDHSFKALSSRAALSLRIGMLGVYPNIEGNQKFQLAWGHVWRKVIFASKFTLGFICGHRLLPFRLPVLVDLLDFIALCSSAQACLKSLR
jgi:hypothetical protein